MYMDNVPNFTGNINSDYIKMVRLSTVQGICGGGNVVKKTVRFRGNEINFSTETNLWDNGSSVYYGTVS